MPILSVSLALLATLSSVAFLRAFCTRPPSLAKSVLKTASTLLLAIAALAAGAAPWLVAALGFGALGDLLLSRDGPGAFLLGLIAFAFAHLAYIGLFLFEAGADIAELSRATRIAAACLLLAVSVSMASLLWPTTGALRGPVMAYILIILAMGLAAFALPQTIGPLPLVAALFFVVSDAILATELFVLPQQSPARRFTPYAVWSLYWAAQALFFGAFVPLVAV